MIPIVDLSSISMDKAEADVDYISVGVKIREAMTGVGCMYLSNHGFDEKVLQNAFNSAAKFFELPFERKNTYFRQTTKSQGYSELGREKLQGAKISEIKESFDLQSLPKDYFEEEDLQDIPHFQRDIDNLTECAAGLTRRLLTCMASVLNIQDSNEFLDLHSNMFVRKNGSTIRFLHYPKKLELSDSPTEGDKEFVRCGEHTDYGGLTLLFQDEVGGLQIQNLDHEWIDVAPIPGMIFVNIGDLMEFWSGGLFRATPHRVLGKKFEKSRYSMAVFIHPDDEIKIDPINGSEDNTSLCGITAGEYLIRRLKETYERDSS